MLLFNITNNGQPRTLHNIFQIVSLTFSVLLPDKMMSSKYLNACFINNLTVAELVLRNDKTSIKETYFNGDTPLHLSATTNNMELCDLLLKYQIDINKTNCLQKTALMLACQNSNSNIVRKLLSEPSIKVNASDFTGKTALNFAVESNSIEIIEIFMQESIYWTLDWNHFDITSTSAPISALKKGPNDMIRKLLSVTSIDWNLTDENGNNAMMIAIKRKDIKTVAFLLKKQNIDYNQTNSRGETIILLAASNDNYECLAMLMKIEEINWNFRENSYGNTAAITAIKNKSKKCLKILKSIKNIDWNIENSLQESPFSLSVRFDQDDIFEFLLGSGRTSINVEFLKENRIMEKTIRKTLCLVRSIMNKRNLVDQNQNDAKIIINISHEFMFALTENLSCSIVKILVFGLTTTDIKLLVLHCINSDRVAP